MAYDVIVIGSGPGGYPAAIRASQLGLKVAIIEKESLGGVCLNWGCIPTKALIKSAQVYDYVKHSANYGITTTGVNHDFGAVIKRSRGVADKMSKGVQFLMKKNKIDVIMGYGKVHATKAVLQWLEQNEPNLPDNGFVSPPQCMPDEYKKISYVTSKRTFLLLRYHDLGFSDVRAVAINAQFIIKISFC